MKKTVTIFASVLLSLFISSCSSEPELTVEDLLRRAAEYGDIGNWDAALADSEQAFNANPANPNAVVMYAISLEHARKYIQAREEMSKVGGAVESNKNFMVHFTLGRMLYNQGVQGGGATYFSEAIEPLRKAIDLRPDSIETQVLLAQCNAKLGDYDGAVKYYDKLRKTKRFADEPEIYNEAGYVMALSYDEAPTERKLKLAKTYFHYAYNRGKKTPKVVYNLAVFYDKYLNDKSTAVKLYDRFLALAKDNSQFSTDYDSAQSRRNQILQ